MFLLIYFYKFSIIINFNFRSCFLHVLHGGMFYLLKFWFWKSMLIIIWTLSSVFIIIWTLSSKIIGILYIICCRSYIMGRKCLYDLFHLVLNVSDLFTSCIIFFKKFYRKNKIIYNLSRGDCSSVTITA